MTVSPHIDTITERIQINLQPLDERAFCDALAKFMEIIKNAESAPTYFELLIAFAYWYFAKENVDYAVVEARLGGLHDITNIAQAPDKVCVITDIGFDHTHILGDTLPEISAQKAGIIHEGNQTFKYRQTKEIDHVFHGSAKAKKAELTLLEQRELAERYDVAGLAKLPVYQQRNWLLARQVCDFVAKRDGIKLSGKAMDDSLELQVPGRMDEQHLGTKIILMDGAHNEQKMAAFVESFQQEYPGRKGAVLLALKKGKEYQTVLQLLLPITKRLVVTTFEAMQDLPTAGMDAQDLAQVAKGLGFEDVTAIPDAPQAYQALLQVPEDILIVTGSFYLVALVRQYMQARDLP